MKKLKLSIIVPIYNIEKYIGQCIESILANDFKCYEIILVNDGSTDSSLKICEEYQRRYPRIIRIINQKNSGLSAARNTGIKKAVGEYVMFVDGDDYLLRDTYFSSMIERVTEDIIQYKYAQYYERIDRLQYSNNSVNGSFSAEDFFEVINSLIKTNTFSTCAWDKLIKKRIIDENKIFFKEGLVSEDIEWMLRLYPYINSIRLIDKSLYVYRQNRENSITQKIGSKNIRDLFSIIDYWYSYDYKDGEQKTSYLSFLAYHYLILLTHINSKNCSKKMKKNILSIKDILKYDSHPKVKLCNKVIKVIGLRAGIVVFRLYRILKSKGLVKL